MILFDLAAHVEEPLGVVLPDLQHLARGVVACQEGAHARIESDAAGCRLAFEVNGPLHGYAEAELVEAGLDQLGVACGSVVGSFR